MGYYKRIFEYAGRLWLRRLRDGWSKMIGFTLQTALLLAALYYLPVLGAIGDEAGIVGATLIAVIISAALYYVYDLWRAPVQIDEFQREDLREAIQIARKIINSEEQLKTVASLRADGKSIVERGLPQCELEGEFEAWSGKCERYIGENFGFSELHSYQVSEGVTYSPDHRSQRDRLLGKFEGKIRSLDYLISAGRYTIPHYELGGLLSKADDPIYRFLLPPSDR